MEEEGQELKHVCKFCSKSFPNGRSLGGHMRSHIVTTNVVSSEKTEKSSATATTTRKKLSISLNTTEKSEAGAGAGYGLRENPKKTWRLTDYSSNEDHTLVLDKLCKECGKGFQSWKALFGHMKCHSEKERVVSVSNNNNNNTSSLEDQDSWTNIMDSQSDTETTTTVPNRRRRSKRRRTTSSVVSFAPSSSVSESELEQEEVAMSLMMLSRDVGPWYGLNSISINAESSNNNNSILHLEKAQAPPIINLVSKVEGKRPISNGSSEMEKVTKQKDNNKWEFGNSVSSNLNSKGKKSSELLAAKLDSESAAFEFDLSKSATTTTKYTSIKAKFCGSEPRSTSSLRNMVSKPSEAELSKKNSSHKRSKFECTTCNKSFHSYQALGGHRASHKRIKGFLASNSIKLEAEELSPDPTTEESKPMKKDNTDNNEHVEEHVVHDLQEEAVPEMRDFLDLNLPAAASEEERNTITHAVETCNRPWWVVGSNHNHNHKQEALIGLLSN